MWEQEAMGTSQGREGQMRPRGLPPMAIPCNYGVHV